MVLSHSHIPKLWPQKTRNRIISRKVMRLCIYIYVYIIEITYFMDYTPVSIDFFKWMSWLRWKTIGKIMKQWTFFLALLISPRSIPRFPQISGWLWGPRPCCAALALETQWIRIRGSVRICGISWRSHPALSDIWGVPKSGRSRRLLTFRRKKHHSKSTHFSRHGLPWEIERTFQWGKSMKKWILMEILMELMDVDGNFTPKISGNMGLFSLNWRVAGHPAGSRSWSTDCSYPKTTSGEKNPGSNLRSP